MKKEFFAILCFVLIFYIFPQNLQNNQNYMNQKYDFAEILEKNQKNPDEKYNSALTEIPFAQTSVFTRVYFFNEMNEGEKIAAEKYKIKNFSQFEKIEFKKIGKILPGDKISSFNYGMFKTFGEFWILKNCGDGYLYGKGFFTEK